MKAVFVDLDGTLLNSNSEISQRNLLTLYNLKNSGILICAVTGRNLHSAFKVISIELPFDYIIFSTGLGIYDFKREIILKSSFINALDTDKIVNFLSLKQLNFFVQHKVPDNHFNYYNVAYFDDDFQKRLSIYEIFSKPLPNNLLDFECSQFIIFLQNDENFYNNLHFEINSNFSHLSLVKATSPLNLKSIWLEIYPHGINKGSAIVDLCKSLNIDLAQTVSIGNDYNDIEMLQVCGKSFVVENSPISLKNKYQVVASNDNNGFSEAMESFFLF